MSRFKSKAGRLKRQLEQLRQTFDRTVKGVAERQRAVDNADRAITFLTKLSPHVVRAARALSSESCVCMCVCRYITHVYVVDAVHGYVCMCVCVCACVCVCVWMFVYMHVHACM